MENDTTFKNKEIFDLYAELSRVREETEKLFKSVAIMTNGENDIFLSIAQLNDEEIQELSNYIDYIISKRK